MSVASAKRSADGYVGTQSILPEGLSDTPVTPCHNSIRAAVQMTRLGLQISIDRSKSKTPTSIRSRRERFLMMSLKRSENAGPGKVGLSSPMIQGRSEGATEVLPTGARAENAGVA